MNLRGRIRQTRSVNRPRMSGRILKAFTEKPDIVCRQIRLTCTERQRVISQILAKRGKDQLTEEEIRRKERSTRWATEENKEVDDELIYNWQNTFLQRPGSEDRESGVGSAEHMLPALAIQSLMDQSSAHWSYWSGSAGGKEETQVWQRWEGGWVREWTRRE